MTRKEASIFMKLELKSERLNPHLKRKELKIEIDHEGQPTPAKAAVQELISKQFGHSIEHTDVRGIHTQGGAGRSHAKVFVWHEKVPAAEKKPEGKTKVGKKDEPAQKKAEEKTGQGQEKTMTENRS